MCGFFQLEILDSVLAVGVLALLGQHKVWEAVRWLRAGWAASLPGVGKTNADATRWYLR